MSRTRGDGEIVRLVSPEPASDREVEQTLRPASFEEFVGQRRVVANLKTWIAAARSQRRTLDHVLFTGPPGLGKTTLANLVAREMGGRLVTSSGPVLERTYDLAGILTKLGRGDVLFVDEIHRMRKHVAEYLYSAMEDFRIEISMDEGPHASAMSLPLQRFTLIGATTRSGLLPKPFRDRFGIQERLEPYGTDELCEIVRRSASVLGVQVAAEAGRLIAARARGTPRLANRYLARVRDVAQARGRPEITRPLAAEGLDMLGVDTEGLDAIDRRLLELLGETPNQPVGLKTLAVALGEEEDTIEEVYEPYLIVRGFVRKTPRGRVLGPQGCELLGIQPAAPSAREQQGALFPPALGADASPGLLR